MNKFLFLSIFVITTNLKAEQNPIFHAISQNNPKLINNMLQNGQYSNTVNKDGQTILHAAVLANNWKAVKTILTSKQININQLDIYNKTAMDYAVEYGHNKMVRKLYKNIGKVTSVENAKHAQKIITRPFKILFAIGITAILIPFLFLFFTTSQTTSMIFSLGIIPCVVPAGLILTTIGSLKWINQSYRNLLIPRLA
jgi:magnesium-transporting ATPase (P-type)